MFLHSYLQLNKKFRRRLPKMDDKTAFRPQATIWLCNFSITLVPVEAKVMLCALIVFFRSRVISVPLFQTFRAQKTNSSRMSSYSMNIINVPRFCLEVHPYCMTQTVQSTNWHCRNFLQSLTSKLTGNPNCPQSVPYKPMKLIECAISLS